MQPILWPYHAISKCGNSSTQQKDGSDGFMSFYVNIVTCGLLVDHLSNLRKEPSSNKSNWNCQPKQSRLSPPEKEWCPKKASPLPLNLRLLWHQQHLPGQGRNGLKLPENLIFKVFSNYPRIVPITQAPARLSLSLECNFRCPPKSWKTYHCHPWCLSFPTFFQELPFVCNHIQ